MRVHHLAFCIYTALVVVAWSPTVHAQVGASLVSDIPKGGVGALSTYGNKVLQGDASTLQNAPYTIKNDDSNRGSFYLSGSPTFISSTVSGVYVAVQANLAKGFGFGASIGRTKFTNLDLESIGLRSADFRISRQSINAFYTTSSKVPLQISLAFLPFQISSPLSTKENGFETALGVSSTCKGLSGGLRFVNLLSVHKGTYVIPFQDSLAIGQYEGKIEKRSLENLAADISLAYTRKILFLQLEIGGNYRVGKDVMAVQKANGNSLAPAQVYGKLGIGGLSASIGLPFQTVGINNDRRLLAFGLQFQTRKFTLGYSHNRYFLFQDINQHSLGFAYSFAKAK